MAASLKVPSGLVGTAWTKNLVEDSTLGQPGDQIHSLQVFGIGHVDLFSVVDYSLLQGKEALVLPEPHLQHTDLVSWRESIPRPQDRVLPQSEAEGRRVDLRILKFLFPTAWHFFVSASLSSTREEEKENSPYGCSIPDTGNSSHLYADDQKRHWTDP